LTTADANQEAGGHTPGLGILDTVRERGAALGPSGYNVSLESPRTRAYRTVRYAVASAAQFA